MINLDNHENSNLNESTKNLNSSELLSKMRNRSFLTRFLEAIVISPSENNFLPYWNIMVMFTSIFSSCMYAFFAVFRKDVQFLNHLEYLNYLSNEWATMFYFPDE